MDLSRVVAKSFAEVANNVNENKSEGVTYATIVEYNDTFYAKLDGSSILTPISSTVNIANGDRVIVMLKNHVAVITGNLSDPSASGQAVTEIDSKVTILNDVVADKVNTKELEAEKARIDSLEADNVTINEKLTAVEADIGTLTADNATINGKLTAAEADIDNLTAENATINGKISANSAEIGTLKSEFGDFKQLTSDNFTATNAEIENLKTEKLSAEEADLRYADIDFSNIGDAAIENLYAKSGVIENLVIENGTVVTGELVGVTIKGDLIEGGTIVADKLVVKGSDGLYYKLNTDGVSVEAEQTEYNSLNGSIITAKSITATKIDVSDLVAFNATIGGFNISDSSIYSGVKSSVDNSTRGIYLDKDGQINVGDSTNYLKFFKDSDNKWKLTISADQMIMSSSGKSVESAISDVEAKAIVKSEEEFYQSTSPTSLEGGSWSATQPEWTEGTYIWRRTATTYGDGSSEYTPSANGVCITGNTGASGESGTSYTVTLSNESHIFPGSQSAAQTSSTTTNILAYKNTSKANATITKIGSTHISGDQADVSTGYAGLTATIEGNGTSSCSITFNATASLISESGTVEIHIVVDGNEFTKNFSFSLSLTGSPGTPAKSIDIVSTSQMFKSTDGGNTFSPDTIKLTPSFQGGLSYSKWQYSIDGGTSWTDVSSGSNGLTISSRVLTVSKTCRLYTDSVTSISFKCISNEPEYYDIVSIIKLTDYTDVEVGGRNYIRNSKNLSDFKIENTKHISTELTDESITVTRLTDNSIYYGIYYSLDVNSDTEYTFSFEVLSLTGKCHYSIGTAHGFTDIASQIRVEGTGRKSVTFTVPSDVTRVKIYISLPTVNYSVTLCNAKLELGNVATDWSPAPEDVDHAIASGDNEIREAITEQNLSVISDCESMIVSALESYVETSNYEEFRSEVSSQLEILASELNLRFTETTEQIKNVNGEIQSQLNTITKYFTFNINGLTIGQVNSPYKVIINNDRYSMLVNGVEVMWISNGEVHTPELSITDKFRLLGLILELDNFGNINCEWIGIPLTITSQPQSILITTPGTHTVTFSLGATGMKLTYQWQYKTMGTNTWNNVTGAGNSVSTTVECDPPTYVEGVGAVSNNFVRYYRCIITDIDGNQVASDEVSLEYDYHIEITSQPQSILITTPGTHTVTFSLGATGINLTYQWQCKTMGTSTWDNVTGDGNSLTITVECDPPVYVEGLGTVTRNFYRYYRCIITDIYGDQVTTDEVSLVYDYTE